VNILITVSVRWWNANAYYAISTAKALSGLGHQVYVSGDPGYPPTIMAQKAGLETFGIRFASFNPIILIFDLLRLYNFIKEKKIEIVNSHRSEDHLFTALIAKNLNIPIVRTLGDVRSPKDNFINRWLHLKITDYHILSSESTFYRYISTWKNFNPKYSIFPGGVDGNQFHPSNKSSQLLEKLKISDGSYIVGMISRLSPIKGHTTFIMAASLVLEQIPNVTFIISGKEVEVSVKELESLAQSLNLNHHILFIDHYEPVNELQSIFDTGVIASTGSEVISRIAMEYLATGIPVVATQINVLPEIIQDGHNGYIIPAEDPYAMADAILKILNDPVLKERISENNILDFKSKFDIMKVAKSVATIYKNLIKKKNGNHF
jgi:glycosyltransferase involved in cell wall biosynthesis